MAGSTLPTARADAPPRIVTRPIVAQPVVARVEEQVVHVAEPEPVVAEPVVEAAAVPVVERAAFASEGVAEEMEAFGWEAPVETAVESPVEPAAEVHEPVVEEAPRPSYPTSSYYEAARQQAWQEPVVHEPKQHEPVVHEVPREPVIAYSEPEPEPVRTYAPVVVEHIPPVAAEPELVAVKASVFDDDFFRQPKPEPAAVSETRWPEAKVPSFSGYTGDAPAAETDELDIPAFLRRNH